MLWERILIFGAHPDDEIALGGTIARCSAEGSTVTVVTATRGETGYASSNLRGQVGDLRTQESRRADQILGIGERVYLDRPTQSVVNDRALFQECLQIIRRVRPNVIFTHTDEDRHRDHKALCAATVEARWQAGEHILADFGEPWYTEELYFYAPTLVFSFPSLVVDVTATFERKMQAMRAQTTQLDVLPGVLRFMEGQSLAYGYLCGTHYAEGFLASGHLPKRIR